MAQHRSLINYKVPYLTEKALDEHVDWLMAEWAEIYPPILKPPIPVEELLEIHLQLKLEIADLRGDYGHPDILGGIWFGDRLIRVDQSLDPDAHPPMLGRYRFTLAHEIGHWRLHREHLSGDPSAAPLFTDNCEPAFVCRSTDKPPEEWQADQFAARLLMPRSIVFEQWTEWRDGSDQPVEIGELDFPGSFSKPKQNETYAMELFCRPLAKRFEVSAEAMRIRLQALGLIVRERPQMLF